MSIAIVIALGAFVFGAYSWHKEGPDSQQEEAAEEIIENITGYDIDISWGSEE